MASVEFRNVTKTFGVVTAARDFKFEIGDGEFVVPARPLRLRQDHEPADDRRPRGPGWGAS